MRIGINALFLIPGAVGGAEIVLRNLLRAMSQDSRRHEIVIFLNRETKLDFVPNHPAFRAVQTGVRASFRPGRILYEQLRLPRDARAAGIDVLFNPGNTSPHFLSCPKVTLIHDLQHYHHPEYFKRSHLLAWRHTMWTSAKSSEQVLTVSDTSRRDIHAVYGVPLDRIHVAEPGVEPELFAIERTGDEPMILCVSTLHPHKNHERLIDAFAAFRKYRPEYKLVLAGMFGLHHDAVERRIRHHELNSSVRLTGWIPRAQLFNLYAKARIAVFPSTFEGFGIPVIEAMAAGVPLIASDISPVRESANGNALLFPPNDTDALTAALERFAANAALRADYALRARKRAAEFTWERMAATTLDVLELAAGNRPNQASFSTSA